MRFKATESDWVGMRALYLLLATDTSAAQSPEVARIINYYQRKYGSDAVLQFNSSLARDNAWRGTFSDPNAAFARRLDQSIFITQKEVDFPEPIQDVTKEQP
jgi:hypothetical protein